MSIDILAPGVNQAELEAALAALTTRGSAPGNRLAGTLGHSKNEQACQVTGTVGLANSNLDTVYCFRSFIPLLDIILPGAPKLHVESCFAISGTTSYHMATTQIAQVEASPADVFWVWCGHNDFNASYALDDAGGTSIPQTGYILPNFRHTFDELKRLNRKALPVIETPTGNTSLPSARWTGNNLKHYHALNRWLIEYAQANWPGTVYCINFADKLFDTSSGATRGDIVSGLTQDNAHLKAQGSWIGAKEAKRVLPSILGRPLRPTPAHMPGDVYDATHNPRGNILAAGGRNPDLCGFGTTLGSAPATAGGVTFAAGVPSPLTMSVSGLGGTTALTVTPALVSNPNGDGTGDWLEIAIVGNTGAMSGAIIIDWGFNTAELALITDPEKVCAFGEFQIDKNSTGLQGFPQEFSRYINSNANYETVRNLYSDSTAGTIDSILAEQALNGFWDGSGLPVGRHGGPTSGRFIRHRILLAANQASVNAKVRMRRLAVRKYSALMGA